MARLPNGSKAHGTAVMKARRLRSSMSMSEVLLWQRLKGDQTGFRFRRQHPVGRFVLDFYCPQAALCVEVDGEQHDPARDARRDSDLADLGLLTLRIPSLDLFDDRRQDEWVEHIAQTCAERKRGLDNSAAPDGP